MAFHLTSFNESKEQKPEPLKLIPPGTIAGLNDCREKTRAYAESDPDSPEPENTRSDPADRIRRFSDGLSWVSEEEKQKVISSHFFLDGLRFLIRCVLAVSYGEKITTEPVGVKERNDDKKYPGRSEFIRKVSEALDMNGVIEFIRARDGRLLGLLSKNGPVPSVSAGFDLEGLRLEEKSASEIIKSLSPDDKHVLLYGLAKLKNDKTRWPGPVNLYEYCLSELDVSPDDKLESQLVISEKSVFPSLRENDIEVFSPQVRIFALDEGQPFGYSDMEPLKVSVEDNGETFTYVFLPPLSQDALEAACREDGKFVVESLAIGDNPAFDDKKLLSVSINAGIINNGRRLNISKTYSGDDIRYLSGGFPSLTLYGPVPEHGWITRRNLDRDVVLPSPVASNEKGENIPLSDIVFSNLDKPINEEEKEFVDTGNEFWVYSGRIPLWLGVKNQQGEWYGGLPLRVTSASGEKFRAGPKTPNFIKHTIRSHKMIVGADIGSSRSAFVFQMADTNRDTINSVLIEESQTLGIPLTLSQANQETREKNHRFQVMRFLPQHQEKEIKGKTPIGILPTTLFAKETVATLYRSGKLFLLDPKNISAAGSERIFSDIKADSDAKTMGLLAEGILAMIVDRAVHYDCNEIELHLSYLPERYSALMSAFHEAKEKLEKIAPPEKTGLAINLDEDRLMYLPESLAIANKLKKTDDPDFKTSGGAVFVDIGDFTTDFAIFETNQNAGQIVLKENKSIQFAGRQIILQPIWDYLQFNGVKIEDIFSPAAEIKPIIENLRKRIDQQKKNKSRTLPEDARRDILCLIPYFKKETLKPELQNLFDLCYLTVVMMIKRLVRSFAKKGNMSEIKILLFGGGSSFMQDHDSKVFRWDKVMRGRRCRAIKKSQDGEALARGLLEEIDEDLDEAAKNQREKSRRSLAEEGKKRVVFEMPAENELVNAYIAFLKNAQALKDWDVFDINRKRLSPGVLFNVHKPDKSKDGVIKDPNRFSRYYDDAYEYAWKSCAADKELAKVLFAYRMAYNTAVAFYAGEVKY
ncbi:MAG: hypothetical protein LBH85_07160 [Treponema sp.]|jgi:hypothetical protein|nr:hypothetical protein [Treponema sp.]